MKKALMNASVASMIYKFNMNNIDILEDLGYQVDVACNFGKENPMSENEIANFRRILNDKNIKMYETTCPRSIFAIKKMIMAYKQLKHLVEKEQYDLVHTQSPIGGVVCRLACRKVRKQGTKVIYTAHGFHFFKGAPLIHWMVFYPIEKMCSRFTDVLITINKEDYELAKKKFRAKKVEYVPGVGVDLEKIRSVTVEPLQKKAELNIPPDRIWMLAVGELSHRKNHCNLIKAVAKVENIYLTIVGQGELYGKLINLIQQLGVQDRVKLLGFRTDILELCKAADIFAFPSYQEGLPMALMEAMACGKMCVASRIRGNTDLIDENGGVLFRPYSVEECKSAIRGVIDNEEFRMKCAMRNKVIIKKFDVKEIKRCMKEIYAMQK